MKTKVPLRIWLECCLHSVFFSLFDKHFDSPHYLRGVESEILLGSVFFPADEFEETKCDYFLEFRSNQQ